MPTYNVRMTKAVTDCLGASVTVEAKNEAEAKAKALDLANDDEVSFYYVGEVDSEEPEVVEVEKA